MSDGYLKTAVLLYSIGEDAAAEVLSRLDPRMVQKISETIAGLKKVDKERAKEILEEFHELVADSAEMGAGAEDYVKSLMNRMLGPDRAKPVISRILKKDDNEGIRDLKWMDSQTIASLIRGEHPQIMAAILAHLDRDQAGEVLAFLPDSVRDDVVIRIALLDGVQPEAFQDLNEVLVKIVSNPTGARTKVEGGARVAAEMLNGLPAGEDTKIIERIKDFDSALAQSILDEMFIFDDLARVDDRGLQALLRNIEQKVLIGALKGAKPEMREKIFSNMSARQAEMVRDEMSASPPMRLADVEAAQKEVVKIARTMADAGEITLGGKGEEML